MSIIGDPGYLVTATMISECAICLATQRDKLPARYEDNSPFYLFAFFYSFQEERKRGKFSLLCFSKQGGILTPSASMGQVLVERLRAAGIQLEASDKKFSLGKGFHYEVMTD